MLITSSLDPVRADPDLFVDRTELTAELHGLLEEALHAERRRARFVIHGAKGVGKTILTRSVLRRLHEELRGGFYLVEVEGRGIASFEFLRRLARDLARLGLEDPRAPAERKRWMAELGALAAHEQVTEGLLETVTRTRGGQVGADVTLWGLLTGRGMTTWTESVSTGQQVTRTARVTEELLRAAILAVLEKLRAESQAVVLFFNDLDQAVSRNDPEVVRQVLGSLVAIEDCVQVVNIRSEVLYDDLRRESETVFVPPLPPEAMEALYLRRIEEERQEQKRALLRGEGVLANVRRLARVNGNPYAFLTWMRDLCRVPGDGAGSLDDPEILHQLAARWVPGPDLPFVGAVARRISAVGGGRPWVERDALVGVEDGFDLRPADLDRLIQRGFVVVEDLYVTPPRLGLEAMMDLLRPGALNR